MYANEILDANIFLLRRIYLKCVKFIRKLKIEPLDHSLTRSPMGQRTAVPEMRKNVQGKNAAFTCRCDH